MNSQPAPSATALRPWLGLRSFTEAEAGYFFGRRAEIAELLQRVLRHPLTVLYSQSGLGKTSLLGAGLMPALRDEARRPALLRLRFDEDAPPLVEQIRAALREVLPEEAGALGGSLWELLHHRSIAESPAFQHNPPVLLLDQFEELFTLGAQRRPREAEDCLEQLAELVENRVPAALRERFRLRQDSPRDFSSADSPLRVLFSLREDYVFQLDAWRGPMPSVMRNRMSLAMLTGPQAKEAVMRPGQLGGGELITEEAAEAVVRFVAKAKPGTPLEEIAAVPPLLSLVCAELNEARLNSERPAISLPDVTGNADQILAEFYERCFEGQPPALRRLVEDKLLTDSGHRDSLARESAEGILRRAGVEDPAAALDRLIREQRLLAADERGGQPRLELTHDVLAPIVRASRDQRYEREEKERAEREAAEAKEKERLLARERAFLRWTVAAFAALAILAVGSAWYGWRQARKAKESAEESRRDEKAAEAALAEAEASRKKANEAATEATRAQALAQVKVKEAVQRAWGSARDAFDVRSDPTSGFAFLAQALRYDASLPKEMQTPALHTDTAWRVLGSAGNEPIPIGPALVHESGVNCVSFSPDGTRVVTGCEDHSAQVWDLATGSLIGKVMRHEFPVIKASFSPEGRRILTVSVDQKSSEHNGEARVWDWETGNPTSEQMRFDEGSMDDAQFSPNGKLVLTTSLVGARVWDALTGKPISELIRHTYIRKAKFSFDGLRVITTVAAYSAKNVRTRAWSARTGKPAKLQSTDWGGDSTTKAVI